MKPNGDFSEALRLNCDQKEFSFCLLAFLSHDTKGQGSTSQLKGGLKKGEAISRGTHKHEKVRKVSRGRVRMVEKQEKKWWTCALYVYLSDVRINVGTGRREEVGLSVGWDGD